MKKLHRKKNVLTGMIVKMTALGLGVALVLITAPTLAGKLSNLTALSAGISFWDGSIGLPAEEEITVTENKIDDLPINHDAGLLTMPDDPEPSEEPDTEETPAQTSEEEPPKKPDDAGKIIRKTFEGAGVNLGTGYLKNQTSLSTKEIQKLAKADLPFELTETDEPQVLIYHTHATESYMPYLCDWFDPSWKSRSTNDDKNMTAVGDVLQKKLEDAGIGVIHDKEHYDASYTGAYDRSRVMIEKYLKQYPSIKVVLDVHRDAIGNDPITAPATTIEGKPTAQVMIISCAGTKSKKIPNYKKNLTFAAQLQNQMEKDYPTLTRPILFSNRHYNQDLSTGALLIEVGSHGNTLNEAKNAIGFVGDSLIHLLKGQ